MTEEIKVILASGSPRRKDIFEQVGIEFEVWPSKAKEITNSTVPSEVCVELASLKALDVASSIKAYNDNHPDTYTPVDMLIVGADTIVSVDGRILGKPKDEAQAFDMLKQLRNNTNYVYTGVSVVIMSKEGRVGQHSFYECTEVTFNDCSDKELQRYIDTGSPLDKAGAYGIQDMSARFVSKINGDYYNVVGFPIARFIKEMKEIGIDI